MVLDKEQCAPGLANTQARIRVHATWDDTLNQVVFGLAGDVLPTSNGGVKGTSLKIKPGTGPADVRFKLKDKTNLELEFMADPIWIAPKEACADTECPTDAGTCGFTVLDLTESKFTLLNPNEPGEYVYVLRFVEENGDPHFYDPIIKNRA
jgi:hypothetical protein